MCVDSKKALCEVSCGSQVWHAGVYSKKVGLGACVCSLMHLFLLKYQRYYKVKIVVVPFFFILFLILLIIYLFNRCLLSKDFTTLFTNECTDLLDLVIPCFKLTSHTIDLFSFKDSRLNPSDNNNLIDLIN